MHKRTGIPSPVGIKDSQLRQILLALSQSVHELQAEIDELKGRTPSQELTKSFAENRDSGTKGRI